MNRTLTPEQQKLVEDNHSLIYQFLHKLNLDIEEFYGIAAIGLCKAALSYKESWKIKFSTHAYYVMNAEIKNEFIRLGAKKRTGDTVSLDALVPGAVDLTVGETLYGADTPYTVAVANDLLGFIEQLPRKQREVVWLTMQGYKATEIHKPYGKTRQAASLLLNNARREIRANGFA
jgi:RNA polymerase sigma factor (sigma-70 family)